MGAHIPKLYSNKKLTINNNQESPNTANTASSTDKDMIFKPPITSKQETKNLVTKETQFKASKQETKNWVTKETKFKARNRELSQLGKKKKMKIQKIETW